MSYPKDLDGSGEFLDVDGDGNTNDDDTETLMGVLESSVVERIGLFDYNDDGETNITDVSIHSDKVE